LKKILEFENKISSKLNNSYLPLRFIDR
jgi:hypothetical protein